MKWREIAETKGLYSVSDSGDVRNNETGLLLKPFIRPTGYVFFGISMRRKGYGKITRAAHRLVAEAFIPNPNNYPLVNHKDENRVNNHVSNLEWCTNSYNITYGNATRNKVAHRYGKDIKQKIIEQYDRNGNLVATYETNRAAAKAVHCSEGNISACCLGYRPTAGNYIWKFKFIKEEK